MHWRFGSLSMRPIDEKSTEYCLMSMHRGIDAHSSHIFERCRFGGLATIVSRCRKGFRQVSTGRCISPVDSNINTGFNSQSTQYERTFDVDSSVEATHSSVVSTKNPMRWATYSVWMHETTAGRAFKNGVLHKSVREQEFASNHGAGLCA